jgi:hypothetical protein
MKKLFIFLILAVVATASISQTASYSIKTVNVLNVTTNYTVTNAVADTFIIHAPRNYPCTQSYSVNLDSASGDHTNVAVSLYGSILGTSYTQIGSTSNWTGTNEGTTTVTISNTTANRYNYYMIIILGTGTGTTTVDWQNFQIWSAGELSDGTATLSNGSFTGLVDMTSTGKTVIAHDGDSLKMDLHDELYPIDLEIGNSRKYGVDSTGKSVQVGLMTLSGATGIDLTGTITKGINFASATPSYTDADNAWVAIGTWNDAKEISSQTEHFVPLQVNLRTNSSIAKDIAAARFRVNSDTVGGGANTLTNINVLEQRSKLEVNVGSAANLQASTEVSENITCTGDLLVGYFSLQGDGNITSGNHVNVLEATNTHTGTGVDQVAHFTENGTGGTITNVIKAEAIVGTATNLIAAVNTGGTVTSGLDISGTLTNDIMLQNDETIKNSTDGTVEISGVTRAGVRQPAVIVNTDGTETLDATMSGKTVTLSKSDGASTVTIPDASAATVGVVYYIVQIADQNFTVTSTTANNNSFVCDNVATSDAVTCSTASHLIGSGMIVIGISATQWYVGALNPEEVLTPEAAD